MILVKCSDTKHHLPLSCSSEPESGEEDEDDDDKEGEEKEVTPESLTPEELEKLKEAVDERKKLIQTLRGKPWPMMKKLTTLR